MSPKATAVKHKGILFRGANGSLWFMRDDYNAPVRLDKATTAEIDKAMGRKPPIGWLNTKLSRNVIAILNRHYGPIQPDGVIHGCAIC